MKRIALFASLFLIWPALSMAADIHDGIGQSFKAEGQKPQMHEMFNTPASPTAEATVVSFVDGSGYTYIEVEDGGKTWWIAGTQVSVKKGDRIAYDENVIMENFYSKAMQRNFDRIVFASSVRVVNK